MAINIEQLRAELKRVGAGVLDVQQTTDPQDGTPDRILIGDIGGWFTPKSDILDRLAQIKSGSARGSKWDRIYDCFDEVKL